MTAPDEPRLTPVRLVIDNAAEVGGPPPRDREPAGDDLPPGCPVRPLGLLDDVYYLLDDLRQLRAVPADKMGRLGVIALFGRENHRLYEFWPRKNADGDVVGWRPEKAQEALMKACAKRGVWDPFERVRGRGAWLDDAEGRLVIHCGHVVMLGGKRLEPGVIGRHVYPAGAPGPEPWPAVVDRRAGADALSILRTWNWRRGDLDAQLMLGWIGAAMIGGALTWRPAGWITGGKNTGKSTLHEMLKRLFDGALIAVADPTVAAIRQKLAHATTPVAVDELESEEDNSRVNAVVKLARWAASGAIVPRGGADHQATDFVVRSCFLFSSILMPPLLGQDRSRLFIGELGELSGEKPPDLAPARLRDLGAQLLRRMVDGWHRWNDTLAIYRAWLGEHGHNARGEDVFGTLLAASDLLLYDQVASDEEIAALAERLAAGTLAETEDDLRDEERCLQHLLSSIIPPDGSSNKHAVGEWVRRAAGGHPLEAEVEASSQILGTYGLKVQRDRSGRGRAASLAIANTHAGLAKIFAGTHWAAKSGASGVWMQALRRLPGAEKTGTVWFHGSSGKGTAIPLELVLPSDIRNPAGVTQPLPDLD